MFYLIQDHPNRNVFWCNACQREKLFSLMKKKSFYCVHEFTECRCLAGQRLFSFSQIYDCHVHCSEDSFSLLLTACMHNTDDMGDAPALHLTKPLIICRSGSTETEKWLCDSLKAVLHVGLGSLERRGGKR